MNEPLQRRILDILKEMSFDPHTDVGLIMREIEIDQLSANRLEIYNALEFGEFKSTGEISKDIGKPSKDVSAQLIVINNTTDLVEMSQNGKLKKYRKKMVEPMYDTDTVSDNISF